MGELRVGLHNVRVGRIGNEDEFAARISLEDFVEEEFTDGKSSRDIGEVEWSLHKQVRLVYIVLIAEVGSRK